MAEKWVTSTLWAHARDPALRVGHVLNRMVSTSHQRLAHVPAAIVVKRLMCLAMATVTRKNDL